jgi:60 kDa SS-A/Ro ribonucleoprotein
MARFNSVTARVTPNTINLAGGKAYTESPKLEFVSLLLTSMLKDQFYRSADDQLTRIQELAMQVDPYFAAQAAIFARRDNNMRSVSHVVAGELFRKDGANSRVSGKNWVKRFIDKVVQRPDDALEILAYYEAKIASVKPVKHPNQLLKGLSLSLDKFDAYQLAKYLGKNKDISLVDLVNLVHPGPKELYGKVVRDELKNTNTWEAKLSAAGKVETEGKTEEEIEEAKEANKKEAWASLIKSGKISYMALLKNLRNIIEQAPEVLDEALAILVDEKRIEQSRVLPFRFLTATDELEKFGMTKEVRKTVQAVSNAIDIACKYAPKFDGETLVAVDCSGSMSGRVQQNAGLFAAVIAKTNNADVRLFDTAPHDVGYNPSDSTVTLAQKFGRSMGGTDFNCIFDGLTKAYDRIIILSDMQGWVKGGAPDHAFAQYKRVSGAHPKIYSFDLQGYGTTQFPEKDVYALAGFSDKSLALIEFLEQDKNAMLTEIEGIVI